MEEGELCLRHDQPLLIFDISKDDGAFLNHLELLCDGDDQHYLLNQLSRGEHYLVEPFMFKNTVADWADKWLYDITYKSWQLEESMKVLSCETQGIVFAMFTAVRHYHKAGFFHGALNKKENYAFQKIIRVKETSYHWETNYKIVLMKCKEEKGVKTPEQIANAQLQDLKDLATVLQDMFGVTEKTPAPINLQNWFDSVKNLGNGDNLNLWYARTHPVIWSWKSRARYFERLWTLLSNLNHYRDEQAKIKEAITRAAQKIENWQTKAKAVEPFKKLLESPDFKGFREEAYELYRFVRVVFRHLRDWDKKKQRYMYLRKRKDWHYVKLQFIEMKVTELFPTLLHDIYWELLKVGIFI